MAGDNAHFPSDAMLQYPYARGQNATMWQTEADGA